MNMWAVLKMIVDLLPGQPEESTASSRIQWQQLYLYSVPNDAFDSDDDGATDDSDEDDDRAMMMRVMMSIQYKNINS